MTRILLVLFLLGCSQNEVLYPGKLSDSPSERMPPPRATPSSNTPPKTTSTNDAPKDCNTLLVISELHPDPKRVRDSHGEFVELYNPSEKAIQLNGWRLLDDGNDSHTIAGSTPIQFEPGTYFVLGVNQNTDTNGGIHIDYEYRGFHLANHADAVLLEDPCGNRIAEVRYPLDKHWPRQKPGRSIERVDRPLQPGVGRWRLSRNRLPSRERASPGNGVWGQPLKKR